MRFDSSARRFAPSLVAQRERKGPARTESPLPFTLSDEARLREAQTRRGVEGRCAGRMRFDSSARRFAPSLVAQRERKGPARTEGEPLPFTLSDEARLREAQTREESKGVGRDGYALRLLGSALRAEPRRSARTEGQRERKGPARTEGQIGRASC